MPLLSRSNAVFLLCFLFHLSVAVPQSSVPTQIIDQIMSSGLARQVVSIAPLSPIVKTSLGQSMAQPIIQGWGGITLDEAANGQLQLTLSRLNQSGYNGMRIGFSGSVTQCSSGELGSWSPNFDPQSLVNCYPVVTDPLNETFLSIHPYFFYDLWQGNSNNYGKCSPSSPNTWGNATAECVANIYNEGMLEASSKYHTPILDTEGGAVYYSCNNVCASPPDAVGTDDASYSITTFHFIQYLTNLMQAENMGWLWWEAGEGSCCGALDTWGALLSFRPVTPPTPQPQPPPCQCNPSPESSFDGIPVFWVSIGGIAGLVVTAAILFRRRISKRPSG